MFLLGLRNFIRLCRSNTVLSLISVLCLISAFFTFLFIMDRGYYSKVDNTGDESQKLLYFACDDEESLKRFCYEITDDPALPEPASVSVSGGLYTGLFWDTELVGYAYATPYGRFFSEEEMSSGGKVALLGIGYISSLPTDVIDALWETGIEIEHVHFDATGNYNYIGNGGGEPVAGVL